MAQVDVHLLRVLVDEVEALGLGPLGVHRLAAGEDQGHVLVAPANLPQQLQAGLGVAFLHVAQAANGRLQGEAGVADDAQRVLVILLVEGHGLLVAGGEHHLGAAALALGGGMGVKGLGGEVFRLQEDVVIEIGQHGGVEADVVLDQQNHLHAGLLHVVVDVHLVLDELDDGEDEVGVAEPAEDVVEDGHVLVLHAAGDAVAEGGEHHAGHVGPEGLHLAGHLKGVVVGIAGHTDDQVDVGGVEHVAGLLGGADLGERGRIAHAQLGVLVEDFLVHASVVFEHKGVVGVGHNEHVEDAARHQVGKRHVLHVKGIELLGNIVFVHILNDCLYLNHEFF